MAIEAFKRDGVWQKLEDGLNVRCERCNRLSEWHDKDGQPGQKIQCMCFSLDPPRARGHRISRQDLADRDFAERLASGCENLE